MKVGLTIVLILATIAFIGLGVQVATLTAGVRAWSERAAELETKVTQLEATVAQQPQSQETAAIDDIWCTPEEEAQFAEVPTRLHGGLQLILGCITPQNLLESVARDN
jgi:hypothetical protein